MEHFWSNGLWDLYEVTYFLQNMFSDFINNIYESEYSWLFYMALLVPMIGLCLDIILSIILSVRVREVRFMNVLSPRSWSSLKTSGINNRNFIIKNQSFNHVAISDTKNHVRDFVVRKFLLTPSTIRLLYNKAKSGDVIRTKDGQRFVYGGLKLSADNKTVLYKYSGRNGLYFSTLKPSKWASAMGSQRMNSVIHKHERKGGV